MTLSKKKSRFSRNGFHTSTERMFNVKDKPPYGYNYALGYCEQSTDELLAKNTCKKVFMNNCEVSINQSSPRSLSK